MVVMVVKLLMGMWMRMRMLGMRVRVGRRWDVGFGLQLDHCLQWRLGGRVLLTCFVVCDIPNVCTKINDHISLCSYVCYPFLFTDIFLK